MSDGSTTLVLPLRSNAKSLVTGSALEGVRRRLKLASILYDRVLIEGGMVLVQVGPTAGSSIWMPSTDERPARWQTPRERGELSRQPFVLNVGVENEPGVPADHMVTGAQSESTIGWFATLEPFARELPAACPWIDWVHTPDPVGDDKRVVDGWTDHDERNPALQKALPVRFVRQQVAQNANRDLFLASASGYATSPDPLHSSVIASRVTDEHSDWRLQGFALPILIPEVGSLPWDAVADLRNDKGIAQLRDVLRDIENEAATDAGGGDLERAIHRAYERRAESAAAAEQFGSMVKRTAIGLTVGFGAGAVTSGLSGATALLASTLVGSSGGAVLDLREVMKDRRSKRWLGVMTRLRRS